MYTKAFLYTLVAFLRIGHKLKKVYIKNNILIRNKGSASKNTARQRALN
jgi:hypothetical protein